MKVQLKFGPYANNKVQWIKTVRSSLALSLKEAKDISDILFVVYDDCEERIVESEDYTVLNDLVHQSLFIGGYCDLVKPYKEPEKAKPQFVSGHELSKSIIRGTVKQLLNNKDYQSAQKILAILIELEN